VSVFNLVLRPQNTHVVTICVGHAAIRCKVRSGKLAAMTMARKSKSLSPQCKTKGPRERDLPGHYSDHLGKMAGFSPPSNLRHRGDISCVCVDEVCRLVAWCHCLPYCHLLSRAALRDFQPSRARALSPPSLLARPMGFDNKGVEGCASVTPASRVPESLWQQSRGLDCDRASRGLPWHGSKRC
jgi:hypothetical protein